MAALDKLYLNYSEYLELKQLLENQPITDFMKSKGHNYPLIDELWVNYWPDWEKSPEEVHSVMYPSPVMWVWLVQNCKMESVLDQADYKTDKEAILNGTCPWLNYVRKPCKKVKLIYPRGHKFNTPTHYKNNGFWIECQDIGTMFYSEYHIWRDYDEGWSGGDGWVSSSCTKFKSVKAIIKHLLKSGLANKTYKVSSRIVGDEIIIKTY